MPTNPLKKYARDNHVMVFTNRNDAFLTVMVLRRIGIPYDIIYEIVRYFVTYVQLMRLIDMTYRTIAHRQITLTWDCNGKCILEFTITDGIFVCDKGTKKMRVRSVVYYHWDEKLLDLRRAIIHVPLINDSVTNNANSHIIILSLNSVKPRTFFLPFRGLAKN